MITFSIALIVLVAGYLIYGSFISKLFGANPRRHTPATAEADGCDYIQMPTWKVYFIQFLNIAGLGPIFGAIMGPSMERSPIFGLYSAPYLQAAFMIIFPVCSH